MRYLLMLFAEEKVGLAMRPEDMERAMQSMAAYEQALTKAGAFVMTSPLDRTANAKTLRIDGSEVVQDADGAFVREGGELIVHDGPYADTREQFGGLYIIEAGDMDAALAWAAKCPAAQWGSIEVRAMKAGF